MLDQCLPGCLRWLRPKRVSKKLFKQLRDQAPRYAKFLPELPRLVYEYLQHRPSDYRRDMEELVREQKRTNRLLQSLLYGGLGFVLGLIVMQVLVRVRMF